MVRTRWPFSAATIVAAALVLAGFLLTSVNWWFLMLSAAGAFGPGLLRELGILHDKDEFQRQAAYRAGYHAFLTAGIVAITLVAFFRSGEREVRLPQELATLFLAILWFTWILSSLLDYWGPQTAARRILIAFGAVWLLFMILSNTGHEWTGPTALIMQSLLTLPFFALAYAAGRWPRLTGVALLAACAGFLQFFHFLDRGNLPFITRAITMVLFLGPLVASGLALLAVCSSDARS
ncbi:MAG: hypothetical protein U0805_04430 [Pirellulales bacterium]